MIDLRTPTPKTAPAPSQHPLLDLWRGQADTESDAPRDPESPGLPSNRPAFGALLPIVAAGCLLSLGAFGLIGWGIVALAKLVLGA